MSYAQARQQDDSDRRDSAEAIIRRIGNAAGVLTIAVAVFALLYFFVLFIGSE